jgi:hypothetical protein
MRTIVAAALLAAVASTALADGETRLDVELGKKREIPVESARGWFCDDPSLVTAEVITRDNRNYWVVTGAKLGTTNCRVGTDPSAPFYVFSLHVLPAKKR